MGGKTGLEQPGIQVSAVPLNSPDGSKQAPGAPQDAARTKGTRKDTDRLTARTPSHHKLSFLPSHLSPALLSFR